MTANTQDETPEASGEQKRRGGPQARHGGLFQRRKGGTYYARWRVDGRLFMKSTKTANKRQAEAKLAEYVAPYAATDRKALAESVAAHIAGLDAEIAKAEAERADAEAVRLADAWLLYKTAPNRPDTGAATLHQYELQFAVFEDWASKRKPALSLMRDVDDAAAAAFTKHLADSKRTPNTINKYLNLLQLVWRVLAKPARLTGNPWAEIGRKKLDPVGRRELTLAELKTVCNAATGELATLLALGLFTGMRLGDCCLLRWGEVDTVRGIILRKTRKTGTALQIPIHSELLKILQAAEATRAGEYVLPEFSAAYRKRNQTVVARIQKHFADCGIATAAPERKQRMRRGVEVGFHSLRHSFVSLCANAGVPLAAVQAIVGHSSPAMTRHYSHLGIEAARGAVAALPAVTMEAEATPLATPADALKTILALAEGMTEKTWKATRKKIVEAARGELLLDGKENGE